MGGMGDGALGSPDSFSTWNIVDQMAFERDLDERQREQREARLAQEASERVVETEGDNDE